MSRLALIGLVAVCLAGCRRTVEPDRVVSSRPATVAVEVAAPADPKPLPAGRRVLQVHRLRLPDGGGSELLGRLDETRLASETRDRLWANGLRVGVGDVADLPMLADLAAAGQIETRSIFNGIAGGPERFDLPMPDEGRADRRDSTLLWHGPAGVGGRSFGPSQYALGITFSAAPGGEGRSARLSVAPRVASRRGVTRFLLSGVDAESPVDASEALDVAGFTLDVPDGSFAVVAASPEANRESSIGHAFLRGDGNVGEIAVVLVPARAQFRAVPQ